MSRAFWRANSVTCEHYLLPTRQDLSSHTRRPQQVNEILRHPLVRLPSSAPLCHVQRHVCIKKQFRFPPKSVFQRRWEWAPSHLHFADEASRKPHNLRRSSAPRWFPEVDTKLRRKASRLEDKKLSIIYPDSINQITDVKLTRWVSHRSKLEIKLRPAR